MKNSRTSRWFLALLALAGALGAAAGTARAYRLPPEKLVQYWAGRILRYGDFEVRVEHRRYEEGNREPVDVGEAKILFAGDGRFRIERQVPEKPAGKNQDEAVPEPLLVVGNAEDVVAVSGGKDLGRSVAARYEFPWLFSPGKSITPEQLEALRAQDVLLDSGYVLWMLTRISEWGIAWQRTRLTPYGDGQVGYLMGTTYGEAQAPEGEPQPRLLFDNREFTPIVLRWADEAAGTATEYQSVFSGYGNDILKYFPNRIQLFVRGRLTDEFRLLSARMSPDYTNDAFDPAALRASLAPEPAPDESIEDAEAAAPEKPALPDPPEAGEPAAPVRQAR